MASLHPAAFPPNTNTSSLDRKTVGARRCGHHPLEPMPVPLVHGISVRMVYT